MSILTRAGSRLVRLAKFFKQTSTPRPTRRGRFRPLVEALEVREVLSFYGNNLFPTDNPWNQNIAVAPVATNSATLINSIGANTHMHADFGTIWEGAYIGIPVTVVSGTQPKIDVVVDAYADESDL